MSYPHGDTYLEQIQKSKYDCSHIREAYYVLLNKFMKDNGIPDDIDLTMSQRFAILGEAFENESVTLHGIPDEYHFMWDVLDALLTFKEEENGKEH